MPVEVQTLAPLRLVVAGSVDDGKSTLVGRLLVDTRSILADQHESIERASRDRGAGRLRPCAAHRRAACRARAGHHDRRRLSLLRHAGRSFILADTPGHVQYTRNTVTGASTADAALILVDVRIGVSAQTRRHIAVMALLRVPQVVFAVNKMDAVDWDRGRFDEVAAAIRGAAGSVGLTDVQVLPISALTGENVAAAGPDWYPGPGLLTLLEELDSTVGAELAPFRLPVQLVLRPRTAEHPDYRGLAGRLASGTVSVGDEVVALPSAVGSRVAAIDTPTGPARTAVAGQSVTVRLADEFDIGRGEVLAHPADAPRVVEQIDGIVCWLAESPGRDQQRVLVKVGTAVARGMLSAATQRWDLDSHTWVAAPAAVRLNDIARICVRLAAPVAVDDYAVDRGTGGFLVIDPDTGATLAAGMVGDASWGVGDMA
ncbi:MAG: sulfate adenylyltransferase subunit 1 [Jatrophihabitans sp.]